MTVQTADMAESGIVAARKGTGYWGAAWRRFKQNRMALASGVFVILLIFTAVLAPVIAPYGIDDQHPESGYQKPSARFILGTDILGRDMFTRVLFSLRNSLIVAFCAQSVALAIGLVLGSIAGYRGGLIDSLIMRIVDIGYAFPNTLLQIILVTVMGRGLFPVFLAIGLTQWAGHARFVRGQILSLKQAEYVEAARALGAKDAHIIRRYLLPNTLGPIIIGFMMGIPTAMITEGALAFIGLGLRPPMTSFGNLLNIGNQALLGAPHTLVWPAVIFAFVLLSFNFLGDGLRDALNPRSEV
jgi:ABC-type dipeptide/oligopeptide/nickel transport system permease subunit